MGQTILVVDDSPSMRQMLVFTLSQAGFSVVEGGNGQEGLSQMKKSFPNLIITDLNMPVMDGIEFIRQVRAKAESTFVPILMLTTETDENKKKAGKAAGATGWIVKPFQPEQLIQVIRKVLP